MSLKEDIKIALSVLDRNGLQNIDFIKNTKLMLESELETLEPSFYQLKVDVELLFPENKMIDLYGFEYTGLRNYQRYIQSKIDEVNTDLEISLTIRLVTDATILPSSYYRGLIQPIVDQFGYEFAKRIVFDTTKSKLFRSSLPHDPLDYMN